MNSAADWLETENVKQLESCQVFDECFNVFVFINALCPRASVCTRVFICCVINCSGIGIFFHIPSTCQGQLPWSGVVVVYFYLFVFMCCVLTCFLDSS